MRGSTVLGPDMGSTCPGNPQVRPTGKSCGSGVMGHGYPSLLTRAGTGIVSEFWVNPWVPMGILINFLEFNTNLIFFSLVCVSVRKSQIDQLYSHQRIMES